MRFFDFKKSGDSGRKMELRLLNRKGCIRWSLVGILMAFLGAIILVLDPVEMIMKKVLKISPGSFMQGILEKPPIEVIIKVYIFNITNGDKFLSGNDSKLKLEEIGPYIFRETRENHNITYNDNGTISFVPKTILKYAADLSVGDMENDRVVTSNLAMLALATISSESFLLSLSFNALISTWKQKVIHNLSVKELLMGYDDQFVVLANSLMPHWISFSKFGLIDRLYDLGDNLVTMNLNDTSEDLYKITRWNGSPGLSKWDYQDENSSLSCNKIEGAYEGILFPPKMKPGQTLTLYKKSFCRHLPLDYAGPIELNSGLKGHVYEVPNRTMSCSNPENYCYCNKDRPQYPDGFIDISPCYYDLPLALSYPHFYKTDPSALERYEGLNPSKENHSNIFIIQPDFGLPIQFHSRMQVNLMVNNLRYNHAGKPFRDMNIPILWIDAGMDALPGNLVNLVSIGTKYAPVVQMVFGILVVISGLILVLFSLVILLKLKSREDILKNEKPIRIIPLLAKTGDKTTNNNLNIS